MNSFKKKKIAEKGSIKLKRENFMCYALMKIHKN